MKSGFSLVELSIVLVILGLLTGGILAGQSLIRAAEIRSVTSDFQRYQTAFHTFRDKYFALPGDMTNATKFWGAAHATAATCKTTNSGGQATCDGDGNGLITDWAPASNELYRTWQHLANAGLIEGTYSGIQEGSTVYSNRVGVNVPRARASNVGFGVQYNGNYGGDAYAFAVDYGHDLFVGAQVDDWWTLGRAFKPEEVWNVDTKMDDGKPGQGRIITMYWDECTNATSQTNITADYALNNPNKDCAIYFTRLF